MRFLSVFCLCDALAESIERWVSPEVGGGGEGASGQGDEDAAEAAPSDDDDADSIAASRKAPRGGAPGGRDAAAESRASVLAGQTLKPQVRPPTLSLPLHASSVYFTAA